MLEFLDSLFKLVDWIFNRPIEQFGNGMYLIVFSWIIVCLGLGHRSGKINLWNCITSTDRHGIERTDFAKLAIAGAFVITGVTFCYLAVLDRLSEWYVLIFLMAWLGERFRRDITQMKQAALDIGRGVVPQPVSGEGIAGEKKDDR